MARARRIVLDRRGVRHGAFAAQEVRELDPDEQRERFDADRPIVLPAILAGELPRRRAAIARTLALLERLRAGEVELQDEVRRRLRGRSDFSPSGATVDAGDPREIEKVYVDGMSGRRFVARGLYAKLSWVGHDERDASIRIRFSFGSEALLDWRKETRRAPWADRYAEALFPECAVMAANERLLAVLARLLGRKPRLSERIVYGNAPRGGAVFHHDCEPFQHGVVFGQLAGETAWLALPKRELARHVAESVRTPALKRLAGTPARALGALESDGDPRLARLLDRTPSFTRRLVEAGALFRLRPGDAIVLPNHGWDDTCWHSVFALGASPSLAHSYGIFAARRAREVG